MRTIIIPLLFIGLSVHAKEIELKTEVNSVTVFQTGAQVTRSGKTLLSSGEHEVVIQGLPNSMNQESIQVDADGNFTIMSVSHRIRNEEETGQKDKIPELEKKQKELEMLLENYAVTLSVLNAEEHVIKNLLHVSTTTQGISVEDVVKAQEIIHTKLTAIKTEKLKVERMMKEKTEAHQKITQQLTALRTIITKYINEVVVRVKSASETSANFRISYVVPNARWYPAYDLRVKSIDEPMQIDYKANVMQQSGEDWNNVNLVLSTGDPSESQERPKVTPWYLALNQPYVNPYRKNNYYRYTGASLSSVQGTVYDASTLEPLPFCNVVVQGTTVGCVSDANGNFSLVLPPNASYLSVSYIGYQSNSVAILNNHLKVYLQPMAVQLNEVTIEAYDVEMAPAVNGSYAYTREDAAKVTASRNARREKENNNEAQNQMAEQTLNIINTEFNIKDKYTIKSEGKETMVYINSISAPTYYQYYCAPRLEKDVFLTAGITDWEKYELLQGQASIFFEGSYVGKTMVDTRFLTDTLEISLGRDKKILVDRVKSKEYNRKQLLGNDYIAFRDWDISIRNGKKETINIIVEDQYPMSNTAQIEVKRENHGSGKLEEETGIITWTFKLSGGKTEKLKLKYSVKYPQGYTIGLD